MKKDGFLILDFFNFSPEEILEEFVRNSGLTLLEQEIRNFLKAWLKNEESLFQFSTSGSTGKPKEIEFEKRQLSASAKRTIDFFSIAEGQTLLMCLPIQFVAGKMMLVRAILGKNRLIVTEPAANPLLKIPDELKIHFAAFVPYQFNQILKNDETKSQLEKIHTTILGGGEVNPVLTQQIDVLNNTVYHTYGMTETLTHIAVQKISPEKSDTYQALPGVRLEKNNLNCLVIHDAQLGIVGLETNDVVELFDEQNFVWLGRLDNVVNSGGIKLFPEKIETAISTIIANEFFLAGMPDTQLGEKLVLFIATENKQQFQGLASLKQQLTAFLKGYEKPKEIYICTEFLKTDSKKIKRKETLASVLNGNIPFHKYNL